MLAFEIEDLERVYDVYQLSVKTGDGVVRKENGETSGEFDASEFDDSPPVQSVRWLRCLISTASVYALSDERRVQMS